MAYRLGEHVLCGEIFNTSNYSTHGYLVLRGTDHAVSLQLTGNCGEDLRGRNIRFEAADVFERHRREIDAAFRDVVIPPAGGDPQL